MKTPFRLITVAALTAAAFSPLAAQAADGEIIIQGEVSGASCAVSVVGGNTTTLPTVLQHQIASVGDVSPQEATVEFALSTCDPTAVKAHASFTHSRPTGDTSGHLPQTNVVPGAATGYGFQMHTESGDVIHASVGGANNTIAAVTADNIDGVTNT